MSSDPSSRLSHDRDRRRNDPPSRSLPCPSPTPPGRCPRWIELFSSDPAESEPFYGPLFGWKVQDPGPDYGGYKNFLKDDEMVAGFMGHDGTTGQPDGWDLYLTTTDIQADRRRRRRKGAQVFVPPMAGARARLAWR